MFIKVSLALYKNGNNIMNTENSKASEPHRFKLDLTGKLNLENSKKNMALANLSIYYTWKNIKSEYNNNKFKISVPPWNNTLYYFEFIINKHETLTKNPPVQTYPNKIKTKLFSK